jgi:hypothetical protein
MIQPATSPSTTAPRFETMPDVSSTTLERLPVSPRLLRWSAISAGAFAAISAQIIFAILGTAIGLSVVGATNDTPEQGLSIGAGVWWLVTGLISLFFGGWLAGRMSAPSPRWTACTHGFLAWCTVTVLSAVLVAMAGGTALGGSLGIVGSAMAVDQRTSDRLLTANRSSVADARDSSPPSSADVNRDRPVPQLTESERKDAAKKAAAASWWTLVALVLGAGVASLGGRLGGSNNNADERVSPVVARHGR